MANELGVSDRTLRRAVVLGLVRGVYMTQRGLYLAPDEIEYLSIVGVLPRYLRPLTHIPASPKVW